MHNEVSETQGDSLLRTKLFIPTPRPDLIRRQRLIDLLQSDLLHEGQFNRRLTLVSAPAGYGKTTLASQWLSGSGLPVAWLTLEPSENDPTRFLKYLIAAIQSAASQLGREAQAMLGAPQSPPQEIILNSLVNDLAQHERPLVVVLDDYHVIQSVANHEVLNYLVEHLPSNIHLVITSREDPPLPLHRLQARRHMLDLRQADLSFSVEEALELLRANPIFELSHEQAELLTRRTEGWVTGLQLAALSMRNAQDQNAFIQSFTGSNRFILDYLFEEVFEQQSEELKDFLLQTSLLDRICAELADEITGSTQSQSILEQLEQSNYFIIPLDESRRWYRYHRLFVDLLRHRLERSTHRPNQLHELASRWYADNGYLDEAIEHAIAGEHWIMACEFVELVSNERMHHGEITTLLGWFRKIPEDIVLSRPDWALTYAWPLILIGETQPAARVLHHLDQLDIPPDHMLHGHIAAARAFLSRSTGDMAATIQLSKQALELIPEGDHDTRGQISVNLGLITWHIGRLDEAQAALEETLRTSRGTENHYAQHTALVFMGRTMASRGNLNGAMEYFESAMEIGDRVPTAVLAYCDLAEIFHIRDQRQQAWEHLEAAKAVAKAIGNQEFHCACCIQEALFHLGAQEVEAAQVALEPALVISRAEDFPPLTLARIKACHVQLAIAQEDLKLARELYSSISIPHDAGTFTRFIDLNQPRLFLAENEREKAQQSLLELGRQAEKKGWGFALQIVCLLKALAEEDQERSLEHLELALEACEPHGIIRPFLYQADAMIPLLHEAARRGVKTGFVGRILAAAELAESSPQLIDGLYEPLSERELEVLRLVAAGMSNRQIAEQLVVSIGTAKAHLHHIFGKLDVSNRTQAVAKARELGLL